MVYKAFLNKNSILMEGQRKVMEGQMPSLAPPSYAPDVQSTSHQKQTCCPSTKVSWLFDKLSDNNVSDHGLSLSASVAVNKQISAESDSYAG